MRRVKYWIQEAIKHPGALTAWLKRNKSELEKKLKTKIFTRDGKIKVSALKKLRNAIKSGKIKVRNKTTLLRRINLAITLKRMH